MKNYPNQASSFERIRATLDVIDKLNASGWDPTLDEVLGYACAERGVYTFRGLGDNPTPAQTLTRIAAEKAKPPSNQGVRTFARELRRTLRDLGWIDSQADLTPEGDALLASEPGSADEQALLVEGLLKISVTDKGANNPHHPIPVLLKLLAYGGPSHHREGLELAFEPQDDSEVEFQRVLALYPLDRKKRIAAIGTTVSQRANAVKILPTLAVAAGLVVEDDDGFFSLSQDGWALLDSSRTPAQVGRALKVRIAKRGRRTTVGKLVSTADIAKRRSNRAPRTLSAEEQLRAAAKLKERTDAHQELVKRMAVHIGDGHGDFFEDEFSYDMLWFPRMKRLGLLFEMKTILGENDAHARVRSAVGQLAYYEYFHAAPRAKDRRLTRVVVVDAELPTEIVDFLTHENIATILFPKNGVATGLNDLGKKVLKSVRKPKSLRSDIAFQKRGETVSELGHAERNQPPSKKAAAKRSRRTPS